MRIRLFILIFFWGCSIIAQEKILTKSGTITFEASVPAFEEVKAKNTGASCVLNTKTGEIASLALMKGFKFKVALMEEHFNENYVESAKYPKATFKGKIENFDYSKVTTSSQNYTLKGKLELHGKSKDIAVIAKIKKTSEGLEIISNFSVNSDDFGIEIPSVVSKKVSKKVNVSLEFLLK
ncbi:MAG: YceI family protein [Flavobacterium sp.]|uniref:YceI family protein n=1 Tax=Flavobacterium celericrescens TaxID=2709780 RepID=A0ABX0IFI7_9FLAO|nr:YceI family protein [Flavobacterium celericrescens]NHM04634.1 YceI family protein [Flavobacterium celericrescens]